MDLDRGRKIGRAGRTRRPQTRSRRRGVARALIIGGCLLFIGSAIVYVGAVLFSPSGNAIDEPDENSFLGSDAERQSAVRALNEIEDDLLAVESRLTADSAVTPEDLQNLYVVSGSVTSWQRQAAADDVDAAAGALSEAGAILNSAVADVEAGDTVEPESVRAAASSVDEAGVEYAVAPVVHGQSPGLPEYAAMVGALAGLITAVAGMITALTARAQVRPQVSTGLDTSIGSTESPTSTRENGPPD